MSAVRCVGCDTELSASALVCPNCRRLVYADRLNELQTRAASARERSDVEAERAAWREAAPLIPEGTRQRGVVERRLVELENPQQGSAAATESATPSEPPSWARRSGGFLAGLGFLAWKFKTILFLALGKLKFLTFGLSKMSTVLSFLASFGVYWSMWGWRYALGFLVAMYVHEMGHVAALRRYGIPASAPMFIPGIGAFVRMDRHPATKGEDARIGLAGPEWGFAAALAAYAAYWFTGEGVLAAIGHSAAFLNLFNLLPIWQLDGGRAFVALSRVQRGIAAATLGAGWAFTREGVVGLITVVAIARVFMKDVPEEGDSGALGRFVWLVAAFCLMLAFPAPIR